MLQQAAFGFFYRYLNLPSKIVIIYIYFYSEIVNKKYLSEVECQYANGAAI